jgi:GNAT superfamily N-acetyltransferase
LKRVIGTYDVVRTRGRSDAAHDILGELPEWFGAERFTDEYEDAARKFLNYLAVDSHGAGIGAAGAELAHAGAAHGTAPVGTAPVGTAPVGTAPVSTAPVGTGTRPTGVGAVHVGAARIPVEGITGILLLDPRYDSTAEVHLLAVRRRYHRTGIGRALLRRAEDDMRAQGVRLLTVKTFGPSRPDPGYDQTRAFYEAVGFLPVEEFPDMWVENPCLLMAKVL